MADRPPCPSSYCPAEEHIVEDWPTVAEAWVCVNCDTLQRRGQQCFKCESRSLVSVAGLLKGGDRYAEDEETKSEEDNDQKEVT